MLFFVINLDVENIFNLKPEASNLSSIPDKNFLKFSAEEFIFVDMILN